MATFVLVHGAWHGSWCWSRVRKLLTARGHEVFTPTLTGLGERSHLLSREVTLETHIQDVVNLVRWEDLHDVVLVGHSYSGVVVRHAADRIAERIRTLVYLDAFLPENGRSLFSYLPDNGGSDRDGADALGDGWRVPPRTAAFFGVNDYDAIWVDAQCTDHPISTFETPARVTGACDAIGSIGYIWASSFKGPFEQFKIAAEERKWWSEALPCGHDIMIDMPGELTDILERRA